MRRPYIGLKTDTGWFFLHASGAEGEGRKPMRPEIETMPCALPCTPAAAH